MPCWWTYTSLTRLNNKSEEVHANFYKLWILALIGWIFAAVFWLISNHVFYMLCTPMRYLVNFGQITAAMPLIWICTLQRGLSLDIHYSCKVVHYRMRGGGGSDIQTSVKHLAWIWQVVCVSWSILIFDKPPRLNKKENCRQISAL